MPERAAHELQHTVDEITGYSKRTRKLVFGLVAVSVLVTATAVIAIVVAINSMHQNTAITAQARAIHQAQLNACDIGNQGRTAQIRLWNFVISLSAKSPNSSPATLRTFEAFVTKTFRPVDCRKLYP